MPAIINNFGIRLTERQAVQIRRKFQLACREAGLERAAMIAQPRTQFVGISSIDIKPAMLDCAVISLELFQALSAVIKSHRDPEKLTAMRESAAGSEVETCKKETA